MAGTRTPLARHPFARLWRGYLARSWPMIALGLVFMAIEGGTVGVLSWILQPMFDRVLVAGQAELIPLVGLGIFGLFATRAIAGVIQRVILARVAFRSSARLQLDLLAHALRLDQSYYSANAPGALIERVQGDVQAIERIWVGVLTAAGREAVGLLSLFAVALSIDPVWTLVAVAGVPLLLLPSIVVQRYIRKKTRSLRQIAGTRTTRLDEIFHGIVPIKLNSMESYQEGRFRAATDRMVQANIKASAGSATAPALVDIAVGLGFLLVLLYGGPQIVAGEKTVGEFMSFFTAMALAFQPLRRLAGVGASWQTMMASLERIWALRDTVPTITEPALPMAERPARTDVAFEDVHLSYGDTPVLRGLSFEAREGEVTALVGLSGAGKSTVFNVLTRLVDPDEGRVCIGGRDVRSWSIRELRGLISVVSQDTLLFDESLRENVTLGADVPDTPLRRALEAAHAAEFIDTLPEGLETQAGPRGSSLSGGQRQRVAIARAILRDTPILLLDEATSALDTRSEKLVQSALADLARDRTTLVIAHRLSTIRDADRILVLDGGRVAEEGRHDDLLARSGLYAQLWGMQGGARSLPQG
jgi:ATP-binding cassette subfamily B protein/subfamily B ATP-binding cassette protein MsbA